MSKATRPSTPLGKNGWGSILFVAMLLAACSAPTVPLPAVQTELAIARFNPDGTLDSQFGTAGIVRIDLGDGDSLYGIDHDSKDRPVLFANRGGDRVVVRLTSRGELDSTFGDAGLSAFDFAGAYDNQRSGFVQPDGKIFSTGYTEISGANQIVLIRLDADGSRDSTFGDGGVVISHPEAPTGQSEVYDAVLLPSGSYLTGGHGRKASSGQIDFATWRFDSIGAFDHAWANDGGLELDFGGGDDRARELTLLPDGRTICAGSATANSKRQALVVDVDLQGTTQSRLYDFERPDQELLSVATLGTGAVAVGYRSRPAPGLAGSEDGVLALISPDAGFSAVVALSDSLDDRLSSVAVGNDGKIYAAGTVSEAGDSAMLLTRFNADGKRDLTFGTNGAAKLNVVKAGTAETASGVTILSTGQIVIAGTVEKR